MLRTTRAQNGRHNPAPIPPRRTRQIADAGMCPLCPVDVASPRAKSMEVGRAAQSAVDTHADVLVIGTASSRAVGRLWSQKSDLDRLRESTARKEPPNFRRISAGLKVTRRQEGGHALPCF